MSRSPSSWQRVSKRRKCPVCGRPDWCLYAGRDDSPDAVICARTESRKRCGESGWLHQLRRDGPAWSPRVRRIEVSAAKIGGEQIIDFANLAAEYQQAIQLEALERLAVALGLTANSLKRLGIGWSKQNGAWTFPMYDAGGNVLGIRLRLAGGRNLSVRGGHEGLFIPEGLPHGDRLLVTEGPTDCGAMLDLDFSAVGRPSCIGGVRLLVELVRRHRPAEVVIVADGDTPGQRGAENLAMVMATYVSAVRIITPPSGIKDARAWKQSGATAADVQSGIDAVPVQNLTVHRRQNTGATQHVRQ